MGTNLKDKPLRRIWKQEMKTMIWSAALGCALIHFAIDALAQQAGANPFGLSYTGQFFNAEGKPLNGRIDVEVSFASDRDGINRIGSTYSYPNIEVVNGIFTIDFASSLAEYNGIFNDNQQVWIQVREKASNLIIPWSQYRAVPYALKVPTDNKTLSFGNDGKLKLNATAPTSNGQMLTGNTDGTLSWQNPPSGGGGGSLTGITAGAGLNGGGSTGNVTLSVDTGTTAEKIVKLDANAKLPAVDGSQLTNINAATIANQGALATLSNVAGGTGGTIADGTITNADVSSTAGIATSKLSGLLTSVSGHGLGSAATMDVGTTANKVVQLDGAAKLPAVDGSALTGLNAANISSGSIANARINWAAPGDIGSTTPSTGTFTAVTTNNFGVSLQDNDGTNNFVVLKAPTNMTLNQTYTLPPAADSGKYLTTDSGGNLSWGVPAGGDMNKATYDVESNGVIDLAAGGTGASTASGARTNLGLGTAATLDVGTTANNIIQLDGTGKLPAVDASALINLNASQITSGSIATSRINWGSPSDIGVTAPSYAVFKSVKLRENDGSGNNFIVHKAPTNFSADVYYTWPVSLVAGNFLTTDGSGNLSWGAPSVFAAGSSDGVIQFRNNSTQLLNAVNELKWESAQGRLVVKSGGTFNTFIGYRAAEAYTVGGLGRNLVLGEEAGLAMNSTAQSNTLLGAMAGHAISGGGRNTLIGVSSGKSITNTGDNVMIGADTGFQVTGSNNTLVGTNAGNNFGSGSNNTLIGHNAGNNSAIGTGAFNVIIGQQAGGNTQGSHNVLVGSLASANMSSDENVTALGHNTRAAMNSVALGFGATATFQGSIAIGKSAFTTQIRQLRIGSDSDPISDVVIGAGDSSLSSNPIVKIRLNSANTTGSHLEVSPGSGQTGGNLVLNGGEGTTANGGGNVVIKTSQMGIPQERLIVNKYGQVGVGTSAPITKLDIAGAMRLMPVPNSGAAGASCGAGSGAGILAVSSSSTPPTLCFCDGNSWQVVIGSSCSGF